MNDVKYYSTDEVAAMIRLITASAILSDLGEDDMAKRLKQRVVINGQERWVTGGDIQGLLESYKKLCIKEGVLVPPVANLGATIRSRSPLFEEYANRYFSTFKNDCATLTRVNRERILRNHIYPEFGEKRLNSLTTSDIQEWLNKLAPKYSHETLLKIKNTMSPVLDAAVQDGYIERNPLRSSRIRIGGRQTVHHRAIPQHIMCTIRQHMGQLNDIQKLMCAMLSYTGMRFEEVLGVKWQDVDFQNRWIYVNRAVVHPYRNSPQVKEPKTRSSIRRIPMSDRLFQMLLPSKGSGFILNTDGRPLTYTQARNAFKRIQKRFGIESFTAHDFRDTCATEWRERGIPTDVIARMLGHARSDVTQSRYVKYRNELYDGVRKLINDDTSENISSGMRSSQGF